MCLVFSLLLSFFFKCLIYIMFPQAQDLYSTLTGQTYANATLPMILSEWHKLYNNSMQFGGLLQSLPEKLGGAYWTNWMPETSNDELLGALQQRSGQPAGRYLQGFTTECYFSSNQNP